MQTTFRTVLLSVTLLSFVKAGLSSAYAEPLPAGCFAGTLNRGGASGTRVRMLISRINGRRFSVIEEAGERTFGAECQGEETSTTRYRVLLNTGLKRYYGQQGDSCEFGLVRSTVSLRKQSSTAIAYGREERYFIGAGGGAVVSDFSSGTLRKSSTACVGLQ